MMGLKAGQITEAMAVSELQKTQMLLSRVFEEAKRLENWVGLDRDYFKDKVTTARIIDAIIWLEREVFGEVRWSAERTAVVKLGDPIDVSNYDSAQNLAKDCREKVMEMLR